MNPCDICAWNRSVDGSQLTLVFHTDAILLAHVISSAIAEHAKKLDEFVV